MKLITSFFDCLLLDLNFQADNCTNNILNDISTEEKIETRSDGSKVGDFYERLF